MHPVILTSSHPHRWLFGGVLERAPWTSDPLDVRCWDGQVRKIERGGVLLTIRTAVTVIVVGPEEHWPRQGSGDV